MADGRTETMRPGSLSESFCPICHQRLAEGDELVATWYEPKRWFVLHHVEAEQVAAFYDHLAHGGGSEVRFSRCGEAGWDLRRKP